MTRIFQMGGEYLGPIEEDQQYYRANRMDKMNPDFVATFVPMARDFFAATGEPLRVTDTFRTYDEQADLYRRKPKLAAPPGRSQHERGLAMDIDTAQVPMLEKLGLLEKHGFVRPVLNKGETWHIELPKTKSYEAYLISEAKKPRQEKVLTTRDMVVDASGKTVSPIKAGEYLGPLDEPGAPPQAVAPRTEEITKPSAERQSGGILASLARNLTTPENLEFDPGVAPSQKAGEAIKTGIEKTQEAIFYPLHKALEIVHKNIVEPVRQRDENATSDIPAPGMAAPEAFAPLAEEKTFVPTMEFALAPAYFKLLGRAGQVLGKYGKDAFYKYAPDWMFRQGEAGLPEVLPPSRIAEILNGMSGEERAAMARKYPQFREVLEEMTAGAQTAKTEGAVGPVVQAAEAGEKTGNIVSEEVSIVKPLRETKVPVTRPIFDWLEVEPGNVFADYGSLYKKHSDQFESPEAVRAHVEYVMESPTIGLEATHPAHTMIVRRNGEDKAAITEFILKGGKYRVVSAYTLDPGQLEIKLKELRARGGRITTGPANPTPADSQSLTQGAGVPFDTRPRSQENINITTPEAKNNPTYPQIGEAIRAAKGQQADKELFVYNSPEGYTVGEAMPENKSYVKINPDGTQDFVGAEAKPTAPAKPSDNSDGGTTMGAGFIPLPGKGHVPPPRLFDASADPLAQKVQDMYGKADKELYDLRNPGFWKHYEKVKRALVDSSGNLGKKLLDSGSPYARRTRIAFDLARGASAKAKADWEAAQKEIYDGLTLGEEELLNQVIQSRRTIAIDDYIDITKKYIEHPDNLGGEAHRRFLEQIPPDLSAKLNERADRYFQTWDELLKMRHEEGLLTDEQLQNLEEKGPYSPRWFIQHLTGEQTYNIGGKKYNVTDSGIKALDEGSVQMLEKDSRLLLSHGMQAVWGRVFRNRANRALFEMAFNEPDNGIVRITSKPKADETLVSAMINGERVDLAIKNDHAVEWIKSDPEISHGLANTISWLSGTKILKAFATGYNPAFAVSNLARDIAHIFLTTDQYSSFAPKQAWQIIGDIKDVWSDAIRRKGAYQDYINQGGGMDFLTTQGQITSRRQGYLGDIENILGYIGNTSEALTRLALRNRALKNGASPEEATWIARNYIDFSKGGNVAKAADTVIPYFNAGIQGTRGIFQSAARDPKGFAWKVGQIGFLSMGLYLANKGVNPEAWDQVPERDKVNNWIVTTPFYYFDKDGNKKYFYGKIAKDQGQRVFATIFETLAAVANKDKVDSEKFMMAAKDFLPSVPPDAMPPGLSGAIGYMMNKDLWANKDVWRGPKVKPEEEYTLRTHPALVKFGKATGMSPERSGFVLSQLFTRDNLFGNIVGGGLRMMMEGIPETHKEMLMGDFIKTVPFAKRFIGETDVFEPYRKINEKIKLEEDSRNFAQKRDLQGMVQKYFDNPSKDNKQKVYDWALTQPPDSRQKLLNKANEMMKTETLKDRRWWMNLAGMSPEAKAEAFYFRYSQADEAEKKELLKTTGSLPGYFKSDRFKRRFGELQNGKTTPQQKKSAPSYQVIVQ